VNSPIELKLDQSNSWRGLYFESNGQPVAIERAFSEGFTVNSNDAPATLTLLQQFLQAKEYAAM
jgi:hypothetical protein